MFEKSRAPGVMEEEVALHVSPLQKDKRSKEFEKYLVGCMMRGQPGSTIKINGEGWKFRLFCNRKRSKDSFCNRVAEAYGEDF